MRAVNAFLIFLFVRGEYYLPRHHKYTLNMMNFRLKDLIEENNIKISELTKKLDLSSDSRIYEWLHENRVPNLENLIKLADYFDCSLEYLLGRSDDNSETKFKQVPAFDVQLKKIMKLKKVSQYRMIKDNVFNPSHFHIYFVKKAQPILDTVIKLADYFKISLDELVGRV